MVLSEKLCELFTYEELRSEVDEQVYGITDDESVPYPWNPDPDSLARVTTVFEPMISEKRPRILEIDGM